jgi:serine phosphatase RsbU (regulator of sigma subunit)/pSer/pThr/pTyr-binding forkhead associated (FHA) protein
MGMAFVLEGIIDGSRVRFPLDPGRTRVGRHPRNELFLPSLSVSREHAELTTSEGGIDVRDLGSRNGTYVDGDRVFDTVDLHVGQSIRFSSVEFALVEDSSFERLTSTDRPAFSPAGSTESRRPGNAGGSGENGDAIIQEETDINWLPVIADAGRLLVLANTPVDAVDEICALIRKVVPWHRAVVLVCDTAEGSPEVSVFRDHGQPTSEMLLLSEESWEMLLRDRLPLLVEPAAGSDLERGELVAGASARLHALVIPIQVRSRAFGCLYLETPANAVTWPSARSEALLVLADLLSVRLSQDRLSHTLRDQKRLKREVTVAAGVQRSLLRNLRFDQGAYEALARQIPCYEVGGDLYDISVMADGSVMLVLGDVSGKGMGAAMLMSHVVATLRALYDGGLELCELAGRLHRQLLAFTEPVQFVTMFLGMLRPGQDTLEYVNAGHCPPILMAPDGCQKELTGTGLPLGLLPEACYTGETITMPEGAVLCVYSDGVSEAAIGGEFYGEERLADALRGAMDLPPQELVERLVRDVRGFVQEQPLEDDLTLMVLRRKAPSGIGRTPLPEAVR